jgi:two-component system, OmpR family, KDP operon response regulator KdpE
VSVLFVDGEPQVRRLLQTMLAAEGYLPIAARDSAEARALATTRRPDVFLLETDLPDGDGHLLLRELRESWPRQAIIVVSGRDREADKVAALELGADDYVTKPFGRGELLARIRVRLRRAATAAAERTRTKSILAAGNLRIDLDRHLVFVGEREVHLTPHEYDLLALLMKHVGKVLTHPQLLKDVWGPKHKNELAYLRVYMGQLRKKLEADPAAPRYLLTVTGIGYRLADER